MSLSIGDFGISIPSCRSRFIFQILYRNAEIYLTALRSIERKSEQIETQLHKSTRNEELIELMELEKTIVYFKASLKTNERVIKKIDQCD